MNKHINTIIAVLVIAPFLILACVAMTMAFIIQNRKDLPGNDDKNCVRRLEVIGSSNPVYLSLQNEQNFKVIHSKSIDNSVYPIEADFNTVGGDPVLFESREEKKIYIDEAYFSDLVRVDLTALEEESYTVGTYKKINEASSKPADVVDFLLQSNILISYDHLSSDICLVEEDLDGSYVAKFDATHYYCTNECHEADYQFSIHINQSSGEIRVMNE
ncbi:MAG: hypothetical protein ACOCXT_03645 [Candidatus Dojkabacteria bacterium]